MSKPIWHPNIRPINQSGFRIRIKYQGKVYQKTVPGSHSSKADLKAAIAERRRIMECLNVGIDPFKTEEPEEVINKQFFDDAQDYLNLLNVEYATETDYKNRLNGYWLPLFSNKLTSEINSKDIQQFLNGLKISEKSKRNLLIPLKGVFDHAEVHPNPVTKVKLRRHQEKRVERFTPEQRDLILSQLSGQSYLYFAIAFATGIRPGGEMLALRWNDFDGQYIHVHQSIVRRQLKPNTKTNVARLVIVPEWLKPIMGQYRKGVSENASWMFPNQLGGFSKDADSFNAEWKAAFEHDDLKSQGIAYQRPYACRHTRAAELMSQNVSPPAAAKQLGHSVEMFLNRYSEYIDAYARPEELDLIKGKKPDPTEEGS